MYRAFMVAYNKAPYKENFYTTIRWMSLTQII
jgi:hypothetical protein